MEPGALHDTAQAPLRAAQAGLLCRDCLELSTAPNETCPRCGSSRVRYHDEMRGLDIAHIDCDAFYAAVEKRDDPSLRDKPLIVGHAGGRGVVTTACYIARQYGPRSAMPMFKALELCPHAVVLRPDMAKYKRVSDQIRAIFRAATEVIEPVSLDEAYLDLSEEERIDLRPPAVALAGIAQRVEREVGITVSIGLSYNKFLAKLASDLDKPRGLSVIGRAEAKGFLRDLSVRKINGVGEATATRMAKRGIERIGQLQEMSEMQLVNDYGKFGRRLAQYAQGEDSRRVTPYRASKSVSAETTFSRDLNTAEALIEAVRPMCERVAQRLEKAGIAGGTVVLKLKTADFQILTRNHRLPHPTQRAAEIFRQAEFLIRKEADGRFFRLIGIGAADLAPASEADPPDLFDGLM